MIAVIYKHLQSKEQTNKQIKNSRQTGNLSSMNLVKICAE